MLMIIRGVVTDASAQPIGGTQVRSSPNDPATRSPPCGPGVHRPRLLRAEIGGADLSREHVRGTMILLMIAGIDTSWSAIGASLWYLARHPATGTAWPPSRA